MGINCAFLIGDLFLYSYEKEFLDDMVRRGHRKLAKVGPLKIEHHWELDNYLSKFIVSHV